MRLLFFDDCNELRLTKDLLENLPPYAILSHTWGATEDEVTFSDLHDVSYKSKAGYTKIYFCGQQARRDGIHYFWVDTCCIDKANYSELTEALVSMFNWYGGAVKCYAFLADVGAHKREHDSNDTLSLWQSAFRKSRWFTRGWTLQELLAPASVDFFSREWEYLGNKRTLAQTIHETTTIAREALHSNSLTEFPDSEKFRWVTGRTTTRVEDRAYCLQGVFGVHMPPIYGEGEENAFDRLKDLISISHRRRLDKIEPPLATVELAELEMPRTRSITIPQHLLRERRKMLLASLRFEQMDSRQSTIKSAYSTTCRWLLQHPAYLEWIDPGRIHQTRGFLWINGKPGAGKSTLVKFAHAHAHEAHCEDELLLSFFFNARGDELERSTIGMYRSLLYQLLTKARDLQLLLDSSQVLSSRNLCQPFAWTIESLCELVSTVIAGLGQRTMKCFIDALDECDEQQVQEMVDFFEELSETVLESGSQLRICFASRHYPAISFKSGRSLRLEEEDGHAKDLGKYIRKHLQGGEGQYFEHIRKQVQEKANGVFMWTVLVIDILNKEFRGGRVFAIEQRLQQIPNKLSDLFKAILRRDGNNLHDLLLCLQWTLFAKRPLSREEFYFAMVAGLDDNRESYREWNSDLVTVDDMDRFVLSSSKGLVELSKSGQPTLQFIHESVRDFFLKDGGLCELFPEVKDDVYSLSQDRLRQCCQSYLGIDRSADIFLIRDQLPRPEDAQELEGMLMKTFPFLKYANQYILHHADQAAMGVSQQHFLHQFPTTAWVAVNNFFERSGARRHTLGANLLYVLAEHGHARLIRTVCGDKPRIGVQGELHRYPLFAALANKHQEAIEALLSTDSDSLVRTIDVRLGLGTNFRGPQATNPFVWALAEEHKALAEVLLTSIDIDSCLRGDDRLLALSLAAGNGYEVIVITLLTIHRISIDAIQNEFADRMLPLLHATRKGQNSMVQLLLDSGVNIEATDKYRRTSLTVAAENRDKSLVCLLLERGANVEAVGEFGWTPLMYAAMRGHDEIAHLLLDEGANIESVSKCGNTVLKLAAGRGLEAIVCLLLDRSANIEAMDKVGWTALVSAASSGHEATARLLLDRGADINAFGSIVLPFRTTSDRREAVLQLLWGRRAVAGVQTQQGSSSQLDFEQLQVAESLSIGTTML